MVASQDWASLWLPLDGIESRCRQNLCTSRGYISQRELDQSIKKQSKRNAQCFSYSASRKWVRLPTITRDRFRIATENAAGSAIVHFIQFGLVGGCYASHFVEVPRQRTAKTARDW